MDPQLTPPLPSEEGIGRLYGDGTFLASVRYTLVAVEYDNDASSSTVTTAVYTGVLHFDRHTSSVCELLDSAGKVFALETSQGRRLACRPIERLASSRLRWIVQLT